MSTPLKELWDAASGQPYYPLVGKDGQFTVGFTLLLFGMSFWSSICSQEFEG
jgi:hypothetical protein